MGLGWGRTDSFLNMVISVRREVLSAFVEDFVRGF